MFNLILLLTPVYITFFWTIVLHFFTGRKHTPKQFLGKFMVVSLVLYLSHFFYFSGNYGIYYYMDSFYLLASLSVYPLYHIYVRLLTAETSFSWASHGKFLLPPVVIFVFYAAGIVWISREEHYYFIKNVMGGGEVAGGPQLYLLWVYYISRGVFVVQVLYYLYTNFTFIVKNNKRLQEFYSNTEQYRLRWVQFFNISLALTSLASIAAAITGREAFASGEYSLAGPSIVFSSMLFFIGLLGIKQNSVQIELNAEDKAEEEQEQKDISEKKLQQELEILFEDQEVFKNPDLKIWDISRMLGTNRTYVSRFINQQYNRNFCNHVNHYRVLYIKKKLRENPGIPNNHLAESSGFGSVSSLYRAFENSEGISLSTYKNSLMAESRSVGANQP